MAAPPNPYRLDGVYLQRQDGFFMQRIKLAAGVITAPQALAVADAADCYGAGSLHLTTRGSIEIHWLREPDLAAVKRDLAMVGLTSRGACGGAVRGVTCGTQSAECFPLIESLARRIHAHFTGNPRFEGLPKKFKIGIEADAAGGRHLIQDVGLVLAAVGEDGRAGFDIWIAGGLGREPRPAFLLAGTIPEERIIPVIEAVVAVYVRHAPPPKRLKYLVQQFGEERVRSLIEAEPSYHEELPRQNGLPEQLSIEPRAEFRLELSVGDGMLMADQLRVLANHARRRASGVLAVTSDQNIALQLAPGCERRAVAAEIAAECGLEALGPGGLKIRVCPGNHECRMGLAPTRDAAAALVSVLPAGGEGMVVAVSGCPNSCSQPQLAGLGIVAARLADDGEGGRAPRYDIYRRTGAGLGEKVCPDLTLEGMLAEVPYLLAGV